MLQVKEITEKTQWESFLTSLSHYPFFQSWNWGEVQENLGNQILRLGLFEDKEIIGVLQVVDVKAKRGRYIYLRQGPVLKKVTKESFGILLDYVKDVAKKRNAAFIRLSRFPKENFSVEYIQSLGFKNSALKYSEASVCWVLDISTSEEELLKNMRKSHRYLIRKSQTTESLTITSSIEVKDLKKFLPLYKSLSQKKHFVAHAGVTEEFTSFAKETQEVLFLAHYENKIIAGAIIAFVGDTAIYRHAMSDKRYNNIPASYALQWEAIKEAKKRGNHFYNFWGIAPPESSKAHPWQGFTLFKTGFGGEYEYFLPTMDLPLGLSYWKTHAIDFISTKRKEWGM